MTTRQQIRLVADRRVTSAMIDAATSTTPEIFRGTDVEFAFAIFAGDVLIQPTNIATVTLEVKRRDGRQAVALMSKTIGAGELNTTLTQGQWDAGTHAHGVIAFTAAETAPELLADADEEAFHLVLSAQTGDIPTQRITLGISTLRIVEDGTPFGQLPSPGVPSEYYTKAESDARYLQAYDESVQDAAIAAKIPLAQKGQPNGVPTLDEDGRIPIGQLPQANGQFIPAADKGAPGGVAPLDSARKVPVTNLPVGTAGGAASLDGTGKVPTAQLPTNLPGGPYVPTSQKGTANGVASLGSDGKVPADQLPAAQSGGPYVPVSSVGIATGVASLDGDGKVPASQLPPANIPADNGLVKVQNHDVALPNVSAFPAFKNYLILQRETGLITSPPLSDELLFWNEGDGGGLQRWQSVWVPTKIPLPLIEVAYFTNGNVNIAAFPAPGSSAQVAVFLTINGSDPNTTHQRSTAWPEMLVYQATVHGAAWTDGNGTHYRFVVKARAYGPGLPQTAVVTRTFSVEANGAFYSNS